MSKGLIHDVLELLDSGWVRYEGAVEDAVYERLRCLNSARAVWFYNDAKATWLCLGCKKKCITSEAHGFQLLLACRNPVRVAFADLPLISAEELLRVKVWLRPAEAAFCLNVSERHIRDMVRSAKLERHDESPLRVSSASVKEAMAASV